MATTIYTYLHNDDLNGSRIVSMDDCMCKLYNIIREDSDFLKDFEKDLQSPALYILINKEVCKAYIGETDDFIKRIPQHILKKEFWTEVMVFLGTNQDTLSKTEVQYLEYLALEKAKRIQSYDLSENTQGGKIPHMNVMQKGKTDKFFKHVQFLTKFVGCDIFEQKKSKPLAVPTKTKATISEQPIDDIGITSELLKGRATISLNGEEPIGKGRLGFAIVRTYLQKHPKSTMNELKKIFHIGLLGTWGRWNMLEDDLTYAEDLKKTSGHPRHHTNPKYVLTSGDGIKFVVCNQWDNINTLNLIHFAKDQGWEVIVKPENTKE